MSKPLGNPLDVASATLNGFHIRKLSETIRDAIRVARLTLDYYSVWWLTRETIAIEDKEANDRLKFEMVQVFAEADFDSLQKEIISEYLERRASWASLNDATRKGTTGKVDSHTIAGIEQNIDVLSRNLADTTFTTGQKIEMAFRQGQMQNIIERVKAKVHDYLVKVEARLTFEERNNDVFNQYIDIVNDLIDEHAPEVAVMFTAAYERLDDPNPESLNQAATSCRRILKAVADHLYPPSTPVVGLSGTMHEVGEEQYVNRLLAYAESKLPDTVGAAWQASLKDLSARLDALFSLASKGVHARTLALFEARHCAMQTYLVVGDLLRLEESDGEE